MSHYFKQIYSMKEVTCYKSLNGNIYSDIEDAKMADNNYIFAQNLNNIVSNMDLTSEKEVDIIDAIIRYRKQFQELFLETPIYEH